MNVILDRATQERVELITKDLQLSSDELGGRLIEAGIAQLQSFANCPECLETCGDYLSEVLILEGDDAGGGWVDGFRAETPAPNEEAMVGDLLSAANDYRTRSLDPDSTAEHQDVFRLLEGLVNDSPEDAVVDEEGRPVNLSGDSPLVELARRYRIATR